MRTIGETEVARAFSDVVSGLDKISFACGRVGGGFTVVRDALRQVTGVVALVTGAFETASAVMKVLTSITWANVAATWAKVTANLALLLSNPFTWALAAVAIASIAAMVIYMGSLTSKTKETTAAMKELGDVTVTHSVLPEMVHWIRELRREASAPIVVDLRMRGVEGLARRGIY